MGLGNKFTNSEKNPFNIGNKFNNIVVGRVIVVGKKDKDNSTPTRAKSDERFNADRHCIRVRIDGSTYDKGIADADLPNCFPLLPKHLNFVPKVDEVVMVFIPNKDEKDGDRYYLGPFVSTETKLEGDYVNSGANSVKLNGISEPPEEIDKIIKAKGVYENPKHVVIEGRNNTDFIQRNGEILIRAGKFVEENTKLFNNQNPGYFQIKYNQIFNEIELNEYGVGAANPENEPKQKNITVTNIVSEKINLITHNSEDNFNLTSNDSSDDGAAEYISDDEMDKILNYAHPLVFGDVLIEYLKLLKQAFLTHRHQINQVPAQPEGYPITDFVKRAGELEKAMLSKNIRIN